jgi:hypothetical protein
MQVALPSSASRLRWRCAVANAKLHADDATTPQRVALLCVGGFIYMATKKAAKKSSSKKSSAKKSATKKSATKKAASKKSTAKKSTAKKSTAKKSSGKKSSGRKYGKAAGKQVKTEMHEMKRGKLKSGGSGKKVTSRKQAIAIGLSEARKKGAKVPPNPNK